MENAAALLVGKHDFKAFTSTKKGKKSTVRTIESITIERKGNELVLTYKGDGFLYHMVRILTGTLIEVGLHERDVLSVKRFWTKEQEKCREHLFLQRGFASCQWNINQDLHFLHILVYCKVIVAGWNEDSSNKRLCIEKGGDGSGTGN